MCVNSLHCMSFIYGFSSVLCVCVCLYVCVWVGVLCVRTHVWCMCMCMHIVCHLLYLKSLSCFNANLELKTY